MHMGWFSGILWMLLLTGISRERAAAQPPTHNSYALIIGISRYEHSADATSFGGDVAERNGVTLVRFAEADARAFKEKLLTPACGGFPEQNIVLLTNEEATRFGILHAITTLKQRGVRSTDLVYFYFAGHGVQGEDGRRYLLPYDATTSHPDELGIKMSEVIERLQGLNPCCLVCFVDACYSAAIVGDAPRSMESCETDKGAIGMSGASVAGLFSSGSLEQSYEDTVSRHGVFTKYLLRAMEGEADGMPGDPGSKLPSTPKDGRVTGFEASRFISDHVSQEVRRRGQQGPMPMNMSENLLLSTDSTWPRTMVETDTVSQWRSDSARAHRLAGNAAFARGEMSEAAEEYRAAIGWFDADDTAHYNLGAVLAALGRNREAIESFRRVTRLNPSYARAYHGLGAALLNAGRPDEAIPELVLALALAPKDAAALHALARAQEARGDLESAANDLDRFADMAGDSPEADSARLKAETLRGSEMYIREGRSLERGGSYEAALDRYRDAVRVNPGAASAWFGIGRMYFNAEKFEKARDYLNHAVLLDGSNVEARYLLGKAYEQLKEPAEARVQYRTALEARPEGPLSSALRERLKVLDGH